MSGFKTGSTINACTRGLWVWGRPFDISDNTSMIVIDSEGLGSTEKDRELNVDLKLFTLCVLISSVILYNSKHSISEDKIEELANVLNLSKRIKLNTNNKEGEESKVYSDLTDSFPKLIWLLRDFSLDMNNISSNEYLEKALNSLDTNENNNNNIEKNTNREIIKKHFKERECFTFVIPSNDNKVLSNLEYEQKNNIRKEFLAQVSNLIKKLRTEKRVKVVQGITLDGITLLGLIQNFIESLNHNEVPTIMTSLESVLLSKVSKNSELFLEKFKELFLLTENNIINKSGNIEKMKVKYDLPISVYELYNNYFETSNKIVKEFSSTFNSFISPTQVGNYISNLLSSLQIEVMSVYDENNNYFSAWLEEENVSISEELNKMLKKNFETITQDNNNKKTTINKSTVILKQNNNSYSINTNSGVSTNVTFDIVIKNPDELTKLCLYMSQEFTRLLNEKLRHFPDANISKLIYKINNVIEASIFSRIRNASKILAENIILKENKLNDEISKLQLNINKLKEALEIEKKNIEEKSKEKNEIYLSKLDLETKYELIARELKNKEKEFTNNLNLESQKYIKMEAYYLSLIKEKNNLLQEEEKKVNNLIKEIGNKEKDYSFRANEKNKEYSMLTLEIEKMKKKKLNKNSNNNNNSTEISNDNINLNSELLSDRGDIANKLQFQNLFKNFQNLYIDFKDCIDKCDKEKENIFRKKYFELSNKEIERKTSNWNDDIKLIKENHIKNVNDMYESKYKELKKELMNIKFKLDQTEFFLSEEKNISESLKQKQTSLKSQLDEVNQISKSKDSIIQTQKDQIELYENKEIEWVSTKDNLIYDKALITSNLRMKEDELDTLIVILDSFLCKNKKKFDNHIESFDDNIGMTLKNIAKEFKIFNEKK